MPTLDPLQPHQFKLFMTGVEWADSITHSTDGPLDKIMSQKEEESKVPHNSDTTNRGYVYRPHGAGVYDSMKKHGYLAPESGDVSPRIVLEESPSGKEIRQVQSEGHHRIAAAAALERETGKQVFIPTHYVDNTSSARAARRRQQ